MINKKYFILAILSSIIVFLVLLSSVYAQTTVNTTLPVSNWNETLLSEFHDSFQIKTLINTTYYPFQSVLNGMIASANNWENNSKPVFHIAEDIKVSYQNNNYSLQNLIDYKGMKSVTGVNIPSFSTGAIPYWNDEDHLVWHDANEIEITISGNNYSLQYAVDQVLIWFPGATRPLQNVTLLTFSVPAGGKQGYSLTCYKKDVNNNWINEAQAVQTFNASNLVPSAIYDVSCNYGSNTMRSNRAQLNDSYQSFFDARESHITRIFPILGKTLKSGKDNFVWEWKIQDDKLIVRVIRGGNCQNNPTMRPDIRKCRINLAVLGQFLFQGGGNNVPTSQGIRCCVTGPHPVSSSGTQNPLAPTSPAVCQQRTYCFNGQVCPVACACPGAYICGGKSPVSLPTSPQQKSNNRLLDCSGAFRNTHNTQCKDTSLCPRYTVPKGLGLGILINEQVYNWKKLDCTVITQI